MIDDIPGGKSPGQLAYEADVKLNPHYPDGAQRPNWDNLCAIAKHSWEKNPRPRGENDPE